MKKFLVAGIAAIMLTACGSTTNESAKSSEPTETTTTTIASATETEVTTTTSAIEVVDNLTKATETVTESATEKETELVPEKKELSDEDFTFKEYLEEDIIGSSTYYIVVTNNSNQVVSISANGTAKDKDGNTIGAGTMKIDILAPGETSIGYMYFSNVSGIESVEYKTKYDNPSSLILPIISNLEVKQTLNDKNIVLEVTNNGDYDAFILEGYALFFDENNQLIYCQNKSFSDLDAGDTIAKQLDAYGYFDHAEVYFNGNAMKK